MTKYVRSFDGFIDSFSSTRIRKKMLPYFWRDSTIKNKKIKQPNNNVSINLSWFLAESFSKDSKGYWSERIFEQQWNVCSYFNCNTCSGPEPYLLFLEYTAVSKIMTSEIHGNHRILYLSLKAKLDSCRQWSSPCWVFFPAFLSFFLSLLAILSHIG